MMAEKSLPPHSPLGGSGAYRWLPEPWGGGCEAAPALSAGEGELPDSSDYADVGTAAHKLAAHCLLSGSDAWEFIGCAVGDGGKVTPKPRADSLAVVDKEMADAVQIYLDNARYEIGPDRAFGNDVMVERFFHCPEIHELFYGQADLAWLQRDTLKDWDYKHGAGIVVGVEDNAQLMYYGVGLLTDLGLWAHVSTVELTIAQPRAWMDPIRTWTATTRELFEWQHDVLIPAMNRVASGSDKTASGEHCRFCPARGRACPQLMQDAAELEELMSLIEAKGAPALSTEQLARALDLSEVIKIHGKAAREVAFARAEGGATIPGWKLAKKRADRQWKEGTEAAAKKKFGKKALTEPKLLSPAQLEKLPQGRAFASEHAFKPEVGLQLVPESDARREAGPSARSMFEPTKGNKGAKK